MPKTEIDYSNTIIYKITCKDPNVADVYVGHTTNFVQRKHSHKQSCINDKSPNYKCKLYEVIRKNGGWVNWKMEIINFFKCHDHYEARKKEQEYFISLSATLNSIEPMPKPKPKEIVIQNEVIKETLFCEKCNIHCSNLNLLEKHNETNKHNKKIPLKTGSNNSSKFFCEKCQYNCSKKRDYDKHCSTEKHKRLINLTSSLTESTPNYLCNKCNKKYNSRVGLWYHLKKCNSEISGLNKGYENVVAQDTSNNETIQLLLKENSDFKTMLMDMMKSNTDLVKSNTDLQKQMVEVCQQMRSQ